MADSKIQCPACKSAISSKTPVAPGTQVKCPKCKKPFKVSAAKSADKPKAQSTPDESEDSFSFEAPGGGVRLPDYARRRSILPKILMLLGGCFVLIMLACGGAGIGIYVVY